MIEQPSEDGAARGHGADRRPPNGARARVPSGFPIIPEVTLVAEIGRGGMGTVYRGRQPFVDREVAVKVLKAGPGNSDAARRFQREARLLARMSHPAIVSCLGAGSTDAGRSYIIMELIEGPDLFRWLQDNGRLDTESALKLGLALARALSYAHGLGIIHRDIKTANVLLARRPGASERELFPYDPKLADLGLARPEDLEGHTSMAVTRPGVALGTPSCMAPEQFDDPDQVDHRADIYGLGCVLFHCLSGRAAFPQTGLSRVVTTKMNPRAPSVRELQPGLPGPVSALVSKMIATRREDRQQDYPALISELESLLGSPATTLAAGSGTAPGWPQGPRRRKVWPWALLLLAVVALVIAGVLLSGDQVGFRHSGRSFPGSSAAAHGDGGDGPAEPASTAALRWPLEVQGSSTSLGHPAGSVVVLSVGAPTALGAGPSDVIWSLYDAPAELRLFLDQQLAAFAGSAAGRLLLPRLPGQGHYTVKVNVQPRLGQGPRGFETFSFAVDSTRDVRSIREPLPLMTDELLLGWTPLPDSAGTFVAAEQYPGVQGHSMSSAGGVTAATISLPPGEWRLSGAFRALFTGQQWFTEVGLWIAGGSVATTMLQLKALEPGPQETLHYELSAFELPAGVRPLFGDQPQGGLARGGLDHVRWDTGDGDDVSPEVVFTVVREGTRLSVSVEGQDGAGFVSRWVVEPDQLGLFVVGGLGQFRNLLLSPVETQPR